MNTKSHVVFLDAGSVGTDIPWPDFASLCRVTLHAKTQPDEIIARIQDADLVITNKVYLKAEHIQAAPRLRYIGTAATGFNQVDIEAAAQRNIPVCNVPDYSSASVAQHVFALMLALAGEICLHAASVQEGEWSKSEHFCYWKKPTTELAGKTLGIVGFGNTGNAVGRMASAFGMSVLAHSPRPKAAPTYTPFAFASLEELFAKSDVVSLHCPLTKENTGMINASLLTSMKKSALLINCARGPLINEADLAAALQKGIIAGAGLDVVSHEPMPDANPLRLAPNCLITPHIAWASVEARTRLLQGVYENITNFLAGTPSNVKNGVV